MSGNETRKGYLLALSAYVLWGLFPLYVKHLGAIPGLEVLANRVIWAAGFGAITLACWRHDGWLMQLLRHPWRILILLLSGALISSCQLLYIWAVNHQMVLEASLGYYIAPLINILLGAALLKERLRPAQWLSVGLATCGVTQYIVMLATVPWISVLIGLSFSLYGLIRKRIEVQALPGLVVENLVLCPLALFWLLGSSPSVTGHLGYWQSMDALWIVAVGPVTLIPLLCFNAAAKKLSLGTLGFLQYISPTLALSIAVFAFHEPLSATTLTTFGLIWLGLVIYSLDSWICYRRQPLPAAQRA
ncbi:EamA family transporter RarD [Pseudomonas putida]